MTRHERQWANPTASPAALPELTYRWERFPDVAREIAPLLLQHYAETGAFVKELPLDFDFAYYCNLDLNGMLHTLTARKDGRLVGYLLAYVGPHPLFVGSLYSGTQMYWLAPEWRRGWNGVRLFREWLKLCSSYHVRLYQVEVARRVPVGAILKRLGFGPSEQVYVRLGG